MIRTLSASASLGLVAGMLIAHLLAPPEEKTLLERIEENGVLKVIILKGPNAYHEGPFGPGGVEHDLVTRFAQTLGVRVAWKVVKDFPSLIGAVAEGEVHLAAGIGITEHARRVVRFTPPYRKVEAKVIYRRGQRRPKTPRDLAGKLIEVMAQSPCAERLKALAKRYPEIAWAKTQADAEELLMLTWEGLIDHTVVRKDTFAHLRLFYPELRAAFALPPPIELALAFAKDRDDSLYQAAVAFLEGARRSGEIARLVAFYGGYVKRFDYVDTRVFIRRILLRLPKWRPYFEKAAKKYRLDWRLLAAMAYQESHWNPKARSKTGVRGLMMLTRDTARMLDIDDHLNPVKSIFGGARYFTWVKARIPRRIPEPDRTLMALAAYNIGFGHLEDARILTQRQGGNPDAWVDVKRRLPLLAKRPFFEKTRHGYARGYEAIDYVEKIRRYYDILLFFTREPEEIPPLPALQILPEAL